MPEQRNSPDTFNTDRRMSEREIKKYEGPYSEERVKEILKDIKLGTNTVVFYHDKGVREITPLAVNTVKVKGNSIHIFFTEYPNDPTGKIDILLSNLELVTQHKI